MEKTSSIEKIKKDLKKASKKTGFVSAEELNVIFDDDSITPEEIDEIYGFLKDNDIEIVSADLSDMPKEEKKKETKKEESIIKDSTPIKTMDERKQDLLEL